MKYLAYGGLIFVLSITVAITVIIHNVEQETVGNFKLIKAIDHNQLRV